MKITLLLFFLIPFISNAQWSQIGQDIDGENANDNSAFEISLNGSGDIVAIGTQRNDDNGNDAGHVRVFKNISGVWTQLGSDIDGEAAGDGAGFSVSLNQAGNIVAVGAPFHQNSNGFVGHVRVFEYDGANWTQKGGEIEGDGSPDNFGFAVCLSSDGLTLGIGAPGNDSSGTNAGQAKIYSFDGNNWVQIGQDLLGESSFDEFGFSIGLNANGTRVAIGAIKNDGAINNAGHVQVYQNNSGTWEQLGSDIDGEGDNDLSGYSLSFSSNGTTVAIGAVNNDNATVDSGHVRVYDFNGSTWQQKGSDIDGVNAADQSGFSTDINANGTVVAIGAIGPNTFTGQVKVYQYSSGDWSQIGSNIDGEATGDQAGYSVSISDNGAVVAVGALSNDGNGTNSGHVRVYENPSLGVSDRSSALDVSIYPNPGKDRVIIDLPKIFGKIHVELLDTLGKSVLTKEKSNVNKIILNVHKLESGIYLIKTLADSKTTTSKLIIN